MSTESDLRRVAIEMRSRIPELVERIQRRSRAEVPRYYAGDDPGMAALEAPAIADSLHDILDGLAEGLESPQQVPPGGQWCAEGLDGAARPIARLVRGGLKSMKVTDVTCHILQCKVDKPFVSARGWVYGTRSSCVVEISTDEGVTGWGECYGPAAVAKRSDDGDTAGEGRHGVLEVLGIEGGVVGHRHAPSRHGARQSVSRLAPSERDLDRLFDAFDLRAERRLDLLDGGIVRPRLRTVDALDDVGRGEDVDVEAVDANDLPRKPPAGL